MSTVEVLDLAAEAHAEGFDDLDDYREWLRLDGRRRLVLSLREETERRAQMLDRRGHVEQPHRLVGHEHGLRGARGIDRRLRLYRRIALVLFGHGLAPSSVADGRSVTASPAELRAAGDAEPGGAR